jgi:preprotein translocase SecE subunit
VAKQTRSQRRARREAQAESASATQRARARQATVRPSTTPVKSQGGRRSVPGGGTKRFISECWAELKKVEWPGQQQLVAGTTVVLVACIIVGFYLYVNDIVWHRVVQDILLK